MRPVCSHWWQANQMSLLRFKQMGDGLLFRSRLANLQGNQWVLLRHLVYKSVELLHWIARLIRHGQEVRLCGGVSGSGSEAHQWRQSTGQPQCQPGLQHHHGPSHSHSGQPALALRLIIIGRISRNTFKLSQTFYFSGLIFLDIWYT